MLNNQVELLAPAGKWDVLQSVAQAGADAVYAGGKRFNMRMLRPDFNFSDRELKQAADYLHDLGKRLYITVNNLYGNDDLSEIQDYLFFLQEIKADGLIIQDLAVAKIHREMGLTIPMHASVQMGVGSSSAVKFLESLGFSRVILSKNLNLQEIEDIHSNSNLGLEFFAHGDMCISHTGQCLFSSLIAGESGNRGRCRKPCRWKYQLGRGNTLLPTGYYLAHKDLCLYPHLLELVKAGIESFKIEGRMRDSDYLTFLVKTYREALDRITQEPDIYHTDRNAMQNLQDKRVRDFNSAGLLGRIELDSIGLDGSREPFFPTAPVKVVTLSANDFEPFHDTALSVPELIVKVGNLEALKKLKDQPIGYFILGLEKMQPGSQGWSWSELIEAMRYCQEQGLEYVIETPRIVLQQDLERIKGQLDRLGEYDGQAIMVNDLGTFQEGRGRGFTLYGGAGLNICNSQAGQLMIDQGLARFTVSLESTFADILALLASGMSVDVIVHGPQCALITDLCLIKAVAGDAQKPCSVSCQEEGAFLIDELGQYYMIYSDDQCRNHIYLPNDICLYNYLPVLAKDAANGLRIEGQYMPASDLYEVVSIYQEGLQQLSQGRWESGEPYQRLLNCYPQGLTSGCFVGR